MKSVSCKSALNPRWFTLLIFSFFFFSKAVVPVLVSLCCFMVYSTRRFVLWFTLCHFVLVLFSPFSIAITSLGEERAKCFSYVCSICACLDLSVFSSSWCLGRAAVCDCGTLWTFTLFCFCT